MNNDELLSILKNQEASTIKADDNFEALNRSLLDSYNQEPYGTEEEGRSQVVASDHFDTVESDMPSLARVFLGSNPILHFSSFTEADEEEAREKTIYADYLIRKQPKSFKILLDWLKEPGMAKCSVVKYYFEEKKKVHYERYRGLDIDELTLQIEDLEKEKEISKVEITGQKKLDDDSYEIEFKVIKMQKKIVIANVPVESFGVTQNTQFMQDAELAFDEVEKTKGQLIADGYEKSLIIDLPPVGMTSEDMKRRRSKDQGGFKTEGNEHWTNEKVAIRYMYSLVDKDGDGIPERRMIVKSGDTILEDIPYDRVPYALLTQIPMPHVMIGKSRGERASDIQKQKTAIDRGIMDNMYAHSRPRMAYDDSQGSIDGGKLDLDDLMNHDIGSGIAVDGRPADVLMPIVEPYIGSDALQIVQYLDGQKSSSLGTIAGNQGLDADKFYKETATRFEGIDKSNTAKIELVSRCFAEMGFRELYEGVIWTAQHYQDSAQEIKVLGKTMTVDPRKWKTGHYVDSDVGLGAGDSEEAIKNYAALLDVQVRLSENPRFQKLFDAKKIHNTVEDLIRALGKADVSRYSNDPEDAEQQLRPTIERLQLENQQLLAVLQGQQDQLSKAAQIEAQAKVIAEQNKRDIETLKIAEQSRQFDEKLNLDKNKAVSDSALQATEIEQKYKTNVPGALT